MALESKLQKAVRASLKKRGWLVNKTILCSVNGWPDIIAIKEGRVIWIEMKAPGKPLEPLQQYVHEQIRNAGGTVYKIDNFEDYLRLKL